MNRKKATLIGIIFLLIAIPVTIVAVRISFIFFSSADVQETPEEIVVSNITDSRVTVSWYTPAAVVGSIRYGSSESNLSNIAEEDNPSDSLEIHSIEITNLQPDTTYYYEIISGDGVYNDDGTPFSFDTLPTSDDLAIPDIFTGNIESEVPLGIVYAHATTEDSVSTPLSIRIENGSGFAFTKANLRERDTGDIFELDEDVDILIYATTQEGNRGKTAMDSTESNVPTIEVDSTGEIYNPFTTLSGTLPTDVDPATTEIPGQTSTPVTPETTQNPAITNRPTSINSVPPIQNTALGNVSQLISSKVSYGLENENPTVPYSIFLSNFSSSDFCVNWLTKEATIGYVTYSKEGTGLFEASDPLDLNQRSTHYTHFTCIDLSQFNVNDSVQFFINSNNTQYGINLTQEPFTFIVPSIPASTNTQTLQGTTNLAFPQTLQYDNSDILVSGRQEAIGNNSTWVSSRAREGQNWSLPFDGIYDTSLITLFRNTGTPNFLVTANSSFNAATSLPLTTNSNFVTLNLSPGLDVVNLDHNEIILSIDNVIGTARPNSTVDISIGGQQTQVQSSTEGLWSLGLSGVSNGEYTINARSIEGDVYGLTFTIDPTGRSLENTALSEGTAKFLIGISLVLGGLILSVTITKVRRHKGLNQRSL